MKCYHCGSEYTQDPVTKRWRCPRCDYWKPSYQDVWRKHKENVSALEAQIRQRHPEVSIMKGHGADTNQWIEIFPDEKNEPDLSLWFRYKNFADIEVTGSDRVAIGPLNPIWIRPGKLELARSKEKLGRKYWFYCVFKNKTVILDTITVGAYERSIIQPTIRDKPERYITIPANKGLPEDTLFEWIGAELKRLKGG